MQQYKFESLESGVACLGSMLSYRIIFGLGVVPKRPAKDYPTMGHDTPMPLAYLSNDGTLTFTNYQGPVMLEEMESLDSVLNSLHELGVEWSEADLAA